MLLFLLSTVLGITIDGDFSVSGTVNCTSIESPSIDTEGSIIIDSSLITNSLTSTYISTDTLTVSTITSPTRTITIKGNLILSPSSSTSFIEKTWLLSEENSFELSHHNWSSNIRTFCGEHSFLGGDCEINTIFKEFQLPKHKYVRIVGTLHLLDLWQGERIEIKADGITVWSRKGHSNHNGINICGLQHPDPGFATKFDIMVPHSLDDIVISFESNIDKEMCHASFAIGDISIYTR